MFDPSYRSCTKFISHSCARPLRLRCRRIWKNLVKWADIVDGALYESAQGGRRDERAGDETDAGDRGQYRATRWSRRSSARCSISRCDEIIADPEIEAEYRRLHENHLRNIDMIRRTGSCDSGVIYFDLVDYGIEGYNKFIPYYLFPDSAYTVSVSTSSFPDEGFGRLESVGARAAAA